MSEKSPEEVRFEMLLPVLAAMSKSLSPNLFMDLVVMCDVVADKMTEVEQSTVTSAAEMMRYIQDNKTYCHRRLAVAVMQPHGPAN